MNKIFANERTGAWRTALAQAAPGRKFILKIVEVLEVAGMVAVYTSSFRPIRL